MMKVASTTTIEEQPAMTSVFSTYDPDKEMMEYMVVMPPIQNQNKPENQIDPSRFHVSMTSKWISQELKMWTKLMCQERPTKWCTHHFSRERDREKEK